MKSKTSGETCNVVGRTEAIETRRCWRGHAPSPARRIRAEHAKTYALMDKLKIAHEYRDGPACKHDWQSGWVKETVELLLQK